MKNAIVLALLVLCGACRDNEQVSPMDGGLPKASAYQPAHPATQQPTVIYRDVDHHSDEHSVLNTWMQWRMMDSLLGNDRREVHHYHAPAPAVVHHQTTVHHIATPAPTPPPAPKATSSSWWGSSSKTTTTRTVTTTSTKPASSPSYSAPKSTSYGFKAPTRSFSAPSRPVSFRASTPARGR